MTVGINGTSTNNYQAEVDLSKSLRTSRGPDFIGSAGGKYHASLSTNLATVISAATQAGAGHIGQFRWGSTTKTCFIDFMEVAFATVTDFTTLQRIVLEVRKMSAHTVTVGGGTSADGTNFLNTILDLTDGSMKLRASYPDTALTDFRMTDTADLTTAAGNRAYMRNPLMALNCGVPSAGATTDQIRHVARWDAAGHPLVLTQDTGLALINRVLWGAAGTATVQWTIGWREVLNAEAYDF